MLPFDALLVDFIVNFIFPLLVGILLIIFESLIKKASFGTSYDFFCYCIKHTEHAQSQQTFCLFCSSIATHSFASSSIKLSV